MQRTTAVVTAQDAMRMRQPGDVLIDCTGTKSLLRDPLVPSAAAADGEANTFKLRLEYALVVTFLYGQAYDCNEYLDQGYVLLKGLRKVRGEFSLTVLAYNLKRVLNIMGVPRLLGALA